MCGIIAAASTRNVGKLLVQGLHKMEYRGYDSAGIALHQNESIAHLRALGKVQLLEDKMVVEKPKSKLGIAHTRWATHGEPSEINAHPHKSKDKQGKARATNKVCLTSSQYPPKKPMISLLHMCE